MARLGGRYPRSLELLDRSRWHRPDIATKTGLMVGLGETWDEIVAVFDDVRRARQGIRPVESGPLVRSPYHAQEQNGAYAAAQRGR